MSYAVQTHNFGTFEQPILIELLLDNQFDYILKDKNGINPL